MKSLVCSSYGSPSDLKIIDTPIPSVKSDEVLIKVHSAALNFPDTLTIQGLDQYGLTLPFVPGREVSGIIEYLGKNVHLFKKGDKVMAHMITGAIREFTAVQVENVFATPKNMSFNEAAAFTVAYGTAYHALINRASISPGKSVAILGASGGVGVAALQLARALGCKTIACVGSDEKAEFCQTQGADFTINYEKEDLKLRLKETAADGIDVICDMVGGKHSEASFRSLSWEGKLLVIGFASGSIAKLPLNLPLLKGADIIGVFWSTFSKKHPEIARDNMKALTELYDQGRLKPSIHETFQFTEAHKAFSELSERRVKGKVIIEFM